jgi:hypothetical protein
MTCQGPGKQDRPDSVTHFPLHLRTTKLEQDTQTETGGPEPMLVNSKTPPAWSDLGTSIVPDLSAENKLDGQVAGLAWC